MFFNGLFTEEIVAQRRFAPYRLQRCDTAPKQKPAGAGFCFTTSRKD